MVVESLDTVNSVKYNDAMAYFPFAQLPPELRIMIYKLVFAGRIKHVRFFKANILTQKSRPVALLRVSRQIYYEARPIFFATAQPHIEIGDDLCNTILQRAQKDLRYKTGPNRTRDLPDQQVLASHMSFRSVLITAVGGTQRNSKGVQFSVRFAAHLLKIIDIFQLRLGDFRGLPALHLDLSQLTPKNPEVSISQVIQTLLLASAELIKLVALADAGDSSYTRVVLTPPALSDLIDHGFSNMTDLVKGLHRFWTTVLQEVVHPQTGQILPPEVYDKKMCSAVGEYARMIRAGFYRA